MAEVATYGVPEVTPELRGQRVVQMEFGPKARDGRGVGAFTHHGRHRVAGRHVQQEECDHHHAEEGRHGPEETAAHEADHWYVTCARVQRCPLKMTGTSHPEIGRAHV